MAEIEALPSLIAERSSEFEATMSSDAMADPLNRKPVLEAISTLYPIEVRGDDGSLKGYWINSFVEIDDYSALRSEADAFLETLR
ncbi:MAG: hypothetical protein KDB50_09990 [Mycobacterium sp.]|nr:hypothetical protein [Mycobacterium sp.]